MTAVADAQTRPHQKPFARLEEAAAVGGASLVDQSRSRDDSGRHPILGETPEEISRTDTDKRTFEDRKG